jgi:hypothetical protein
MKKSIFPGLAALAFLGACATATPYQPATPGDRGYSNQQIESNRWMVNFSGNSLTDRQTVETYLLYRAAELTAQNGYDSFRMVRRETDADSNFVPVGGSFTHFNPYYRYYGRRGRVYGYAPYGWHDPFFQRAPDYREVTRFDAMAEIVMSRGPKPADPAWYSADEVVVNLSGRIQRPEIG